ncbi:MAG: hypothetical protein O3C15_06365 [Proteobacteria bacterium]|nr:hypothetical protein [Pseudomonadota bacterium]
MLHIMIPRLGEGKIPSYDLEIIRITEDRFDAPAPTVFSDTQLVFGLESYSEHKGRLGDSSSYDSQAMNLWVSRVEVFRILGRCDTCEINANAMENGDQLSKDADTISLTERQVIVSAYLGMTAKATALSMHRSVATIRAHRQNIKRKIGGALSPIAIFRLVYAHRVLEDMSGVSNVFGLGKHLKYLPEPVLD